MKDITIITERKEREENVRDCYRVIRCMNGIFGYAVDHLIGKLDHIYGKFTITWLSMRLTSLTFIALLKSADRSVN